MNQETTKKAAILIAFDDFKDEEYLIPKSILEQAGIKVTTVSNQVGTAHGAEGEKVAVDMDLEHLRADDFDGIVLIGGPGCLKHLNNLTLQRVIIEADKQGKLLAAICISPVILAESGALYQKKATVWSSSIDEQGIKTLGNRGAIFIDRPVVVDKNVITANGPQAAEDFGRAIVEKLTS